MIVEAMRDTDSEIEVRLVECFGAAGKATLKLNLPHSTATLTDLTGARRTALKARTRTSTAAEYALEIRPQQIVTLRFEVAASVTPVKALTTFDSVVPAAKRAATRGFKHPNLKGTRP